MGCELWALDPEAGEAILRQEDCWYLSAMDRRWQPVELESPQGVLEWSLTRAVVPVGRAYGTRDEAVIVARQACRTAWRAGITSPAGIGSIIAGIEAERGPRQAADPSEWSRRFPEINRAALELDRYFQAQGCTVEESLDWICQALQKLRESSDWPQSGPELRLVLRRLAGAVQREARGRPERTSPQGSQLSDHERRRLTKDLERLPLEVLEILTCWADSGHDEEEIATLLRATRKEVRRALEASFEALGQSGHALRGAAFAELCKETLRRRS